MSLAGAIHARLNADQTLTAALATYRGQPAILTVDTLPEDVEPPFIVIAAAELDEPDDCKVEEGREQARPVRIYTAATGSVVAVDALAERVRRLLHRRPVGLADGAWRAVCSGPYLAPTDTTFYGREVTVRVTSLTQPHEESP